MKKAREGESEDMMWITMQGERIWVNDMGDKHVRNALRLLMRREIKTLKRLRDTEMELTKTRNILNRGDKLKKYCER